MGHRMERNAKTMLGHPSLRYETIIKTTPFFDNTQGYVYNGVRSSESQVACDAQKDTGRRLNIAEPRGRTLVPRPAGSFVRGSHCGWAESSAKWDG